MNSFDGAATLTAEHNWSHDHFQLEKLWATGCTGRGVRIGHLDSGVDGQHPALTSKVAAFLATDRNGISSNPAIPTDPVGHGTHTAGIICGTSDPGVSIGVAPDARLLSAAVIEGGKVIKRVLRGLEWVRRQDVKVLCLGFGTPGLNPIFRPLVQRIRAEGTLVVAAVGNGGATHALSPACYPEVLAVGAVDRDMKVPKFSATLHDFRYSICRKPDLLAPGVRILSAQAGGGYGCRSGTSQAGAFVAGIAALLFEAAPDATVEAIESALLGSTRPIHPSQRHRCRLGVVDPMNALGALRDVLGPENNPPRLPPQPEITATIYRDPRLLDACSYAEEDQAIEAIINTTPLLDQTYDDVFWKVVEQTYAIIHRHPDQIEAFADTPTFCVKANKAFIVQLLKHPHVAAASAPDIASFGT